jgi:ATP-dependent RNA helicase DeaD
VDDLVQHLQARGYSAEGLHGEHKQAMRDRIMARFRSGAVEILVATDVAARGIDVKDIEMVVNFDLPKDEEDYVHRIGRTGRAGKKGLALSFASGKDLFRLRNIERFSKSKIVRRAVPTLDQVESAQHSVLLDKVRETLAAGGLERYATLVDSLSEGETTASDVACALLKMALPDAPARAGKGEDAFQAGNAFGERGGYGKGGSDREGRFDRGDRGERQDRGDRFGKGIKPFQGRDARTGPDTRLFSGGIPAQVFLNVGRLQDVRPKDILGAMAGETGLPGTAFGSINVQSKHTLVEVPEDQLDMILDKLKKVRIKGVPVKARRAEF